MTKLLPSLALALVVSSGLAVPALANDSLTAGDSSFNSAYVLKGLQQNGVNAVDVAQDWDGRVRATVRLDDGSQTFQYFDEFTLQPIGETGSNSRVLSQVDNGRAPVGTDTRSLLWQGDGSSFNY